jgi:hypothetical protein
MIAARKVASVRTVARTADLTGALTREPAGDRDGRYGWTLQFTDGRHLRLLMPGVELTRLRDDITAAAPCLYLNGHAYWWNDAVARRRRPHLPQYLLTGGLTYRNTS